MELLELFKSVSEKSLSKEQIEDYHSQLAGLYAQMQNEIAEIKKLKAIYFLEQRQKTDIATSRAWAGTNEGLREIDLFHNSKGVEKLLGSLKSRLYTIY